MDLSTTWTVKRPTAADPEAGKQPRFSKSRLQEKTEYFIINITKDYYWNQESFSHKDVPSFPHVLTSPMPNGPPWKFRGLSSISAGYWRVSRSEIPVGSSGGTALTPSHERLLLGCDGNAGNAFQTKQGKEPSSRTTRPKRGSSWCWRDPRCSPRVDPRVKTGMYGTSRVAARVWRTLSKFKREVL